MLLMLEKIKIKCQINVKHYENIFCTHYFILLYINNIVNIFILLKIRVLPLIIKIMIFFFIYFFICYIKYFYIYKQIKTFFA